MKIGMDMQALRWVPAAGLFYHVWNLFDSLRATLGESQVVPFLYGHPALIESEQVRKLREKGLHRHLRYFWDGPRVPLVSRIFGGSLRQAPSAVRYFDRRLLFRAWRRLQKNGTDNHSTGSDKPSKAFQGIDVFHHIELPLFPPGEFPVNVMTIPDLTTLRVPKFHQAENIELVGDIRQVVPRMDMLITESEHTKKDVVELLEVDPDRVAVTPLAAHKQFAPVKDKQKLRDVLTRHDLNDRPYIITLGTLEPRKNHWRLIDAFGKMKKTGKLPQHRLVLIGGKGWLFDEVFAAIANAGLQSEVKWLGYVPFEDLPALLSAADVFVYPSLYEGFGLPPLEAMSCGAAVVASNTTSVPEVVGDAGVLVDPENVDELAAAMLEVISNREHRALLCRKALARAQTFSWERTAQLTVQAYERARSFAKARVHSALDAQSTSKCRTNMRQWVMDELHASYGR